MTVIRLKNCAQSWYIRRGRFVWRQKSSRVNAVSNARFFFFIPWNELRFFFFFGFRRHKHFTSHSKFSLFSLVFSFDKTFSYAWVSLKSVSLLLRWMERPALSFSDKTRKTASAFRTFSLQVKMSSGSCFISWFIIVIPSAQISRNRGADRWVSLQPPVCLLTSQFRRRDERQIVLRRRRVRNALEPRGRLRPITPCWERREWQRQPRGAVRLSKTSRQQQRLERLDIDDVIVQRISYAIEFYLLIGFFACLSNFLSYFTNNIPNNRYGQQDNNNGRLQHPPPPFLFPVIFDCVILSVSLTNNE